MARQSASIFSRDLVLAAIRDSFPKLDPRLQFRNPVMFIVELGSAITNRDLRPRPSPAATRATSGSSG